MNVEQVTDVLRGLRVKSGLNGTSKPLGGRWSIRFGYDRTEARFMLTLVHHGANKSRAVALAEDDVETRSRARWMTEKTFRLTEPAVLKFAEQLVPAMQKFDARQP